MSITIPRGSSHTLEVVGLGDLTGAAVYLTVQSLAGEDVITKSTDDVAEALILTPVTDGKVDIYFLPEDTAELLGAYRYDIWVVYGSGKRYQVRSVSPFQVTGRVTRIE